MLEACRRQGVSIRPWNDLQGWKKPLIDVTKPVVPHLYRRAVGGYYSSGHYCRASLTRNRVISHAPSVAPHLHRWVLLRGLYYWATSPPIYHVPETKPVGRPSQFISLMIVRSTALQLKSSAAVQLRCVSNNSISPVGGHMEIFIVISSAEKRSLGEVPSPQLAALQLN